MHELERQRTSVETGLGSDLNQFVEQFKKSRAALQVPQFSRFALLGRTLIIHLASVLQSKLNFAPSCFESLNGRAGLRMRSD